MNTLSRERKAGKDLQLERILFSLASTNDRSDILIIKKELQNLKAELSSFKDSVMVDLLEMKQNSNERESSRQVMSITGDEFVSSKREKIKILLP